MRPDMVAVSDTHPELGANPDFDQVNALRQNLHLSGSVNRGGRIFFGSVLMISALGLWLVPVEAGDTAMQLIKLLVSVVMIVLGMIITLSVSDKEDLPEIRVDTIKRELRVLRLDNVNKPYLQARHGFDALTDITSNKRHLTAQDALDAAV